MIKIVERNFNVGIVVDVLLAHANKSPPLPPMKEDKT